MTVSRVSLLLASTACFATPGEIPSTGDRPDSPVAAVAGDYYHGDGLGVNCSLVVKREGRFSFVWRGCMGVYDQNTGEAEVVAGHLILTPERPNVRKGFRGTATDFHIVRWGARSYLIPEEDKQEFVNAVNQGQEPRERPHGSFYLRRGDWEKKVAGLPETPREWEPLFLKKPLHGKVIEVLGDDRARVDLGADSGVWKDMELWADGEGFGLVQVVEVGAKNSVISTKHPDVDQIRFQKGQGVRSRLSIED